MAVLHRATLSPTKLELLATWLPRCPWYQESELARVASYRFDDPAGEVGVETMIVRGTDRPVIQVPLTYRAAPLSGAEAYLIGTTDHSVLGPRWVYDGCGDPVYVQALATAILTGGTQADEFVDHDGELVRREATTWVNGSGAGETELVGSVLRVDDGDPVRILTDQFEFVIPRILPTDDRPEPLRLTGRWEGQDAPQPLAYLRRS
jgi:maltokinase-like protein